MAALKIAFCDLKAARPSLRLEQARRLKQRLPLGEVYKELMDGCASAGEGALDNSAVIREIRRRAG